jgi:hypothetical protein
MSTVSRYISRMHWLVQKRAYEITTAYNAHIKAMEKDLGHAVGAGGLGILFGYLAFVDAGFGCMLASVGCLGWSGLAAWSRQKTESILETRAPFARLCKKPLAAVELHLPLYSEAWENLTERLPPLATDTSVEEEALKLIAALNRDIEL